MRSEPSAFGGEPVEIWRFGQRVTIATQDVAGMVVRQDEDEIRLAFLRANGGRRCSGPTRTPVGSACFEHISQAVQEPSSEYPAPRASRITPSTMAMPFSTIPAVAAPLRPPGTCDFATMLMISPTMANGMFSQFKEPRQGTNAIPRPKNR